MSKPKEILGSCQQLSALVGGVGFLCVFGTCRAFVVPAEVFHTLCPHVDYSRAPVFASLRVLELMSAQFLPLILM